MGLDNPLHIAFLVVILLLVFGAKRLPEIGRSLGSGMREFKDSITGDDKHDEETDATGRPVLTQAQGDAPVVAERAPQATPQAADSGPDQRA
jgi:sec-independent protein translocase protein TatA